MQYPEITSVAVEQAWSKPGSLKPRGSHHLEPQGFKGLFVSGTMGHFIIERCGALGTSCRWRTLATSGGGALASPPVSYWRSMWPI